jgi:hypothetical protein
MFYLRRDKSRLYVGIDKNQGIDKIILDYGRKIQK